MSPLSQSEKAGLCAEVLLALSQTPYACSSLTQLTNGTTNLVFRSILTQSLPTTKTVIIKRTLGYAPLNKNLKISVSRSTIEASMLGNLETFSNTDLTIYAPRLLFFDRESNTQVIEDVSDVIDLKTNLVSQDLALSHSQATSIGRCLGSWLCSFHKWASDNTLHTKTGKNDDMRELKYQISYGRFLEILEQFPDILGPNREILQEVKRQAWEEFKNDRYRGDQWGMIHGDFWSGNILLPQQTDKIKDARLSVVDWEMAQYGHRAFDIGQMLGDLYERKHFNNSTSAIWIMEAFIAGYGAVNEDMAFRITISTGLQMIGWMDRGPPLDMRPNWATLEKAREIVDLGMKFVIKGWHRDKPWFKESILRGLFMR